MIACHRLGDYSTLAPRRVSLGWCGDSLCILRCNTPCNRIPLYDSSAASVPK